MIKWLTEYMDEAVECQSVALATVLNAQFWGKFFTIHYPNHDISANLDIEEAFNTCLEELEEQELTTTDEDDSGPTEPKTFDIFGVSNSGTNKLSTSELEDYLHGKYPIKKDQTPLSWWRVCLIFFTLSI